jgi:hypothetical protein
MLELQREIGVLNQRIEVLQREKADLSETHCEPDADAGVVPRKSLVVFDASQIPVELTSSLADLNDIFSALHQTSSGKEVIDTLFASSSEPQVESAAETSSSPAVGLKSQGGLKSLIRAALASPVKK